jgi:putative membrane protein
VNKLPSKAVWSIFSRWMVGIAFAVIFMGFYMWANVFDDGPGFPLRWIFYLLVLLAVPTFLWAYLWTKLYEYDVTEQGFKSNSGVIIRRETTIPYARIQNIEIYRGIVDRLLGMSEVRIQTAGGSGQVKAEGIVPGLAVKVAEELQNKLLSKSK